MVKRNIVLGTIIVVLITIYYQFYTIQDVTQCNIYMLDFAMVACTISIVVLRLVTIYYQFFTIQDVTQCDINVLHFAMVASAI